jgi:hypothetical protein
VPKVAHVRHQGDMSPLAAKRRRLDDVTVTANAGADGKVDVSKATLDGCIRMTPSDPDGLNFDMANGCTTPSLALELEPPSSFVFPGGPYPTAMTANEPFVMDWLPTNHMPLPFETTRLASVEGDLTPTAPTVLTFPSLLPSGPAPPSDGLQASLAALEVKSHAVRLAKVRLEQSDKSTALTYGRHITRYEKWWADDQEEYVEKHPGWTCIPAFPITPAKACVFLEHESTREKVSPLPVCPPPCSYSPPRFSNTSKRKAASRPSPTPGSASSPSHRPSRLWSTGGSTTRISTRGCPKCRCPCVRTTASRPSSHPRSMTNRRGSRARNSSRQREALRVSAVPPFGFGPPR